MKKTFLISLFLLFTSSVFAVSIPGGGLGTEEHVSDDYFYLPGAGNFRSQEQANTVYDNPDNLWEGTWGTTGGGSDVAEAAMGDPLQYVKDNHTKYELTPVGTYSEHLYGEYLLTTVTQECVNKVGSEYYLDCQNYAVDVYNLMFQVAHIDLSEDHYFRGYFSVPVSTDITFMALMLAAYLGFAAYRKKRSVAKI